MGCQDSKLSSYSNQINLSVIDPAFLKPNNDLLRNQLKQQGVTINTYMSIDCFISDQKASYSNNVLIRAHELQELLTCLQEINSNPKIYVLGKRKLQEQSSQNQKRLIFIPNYEGLLRELSQVQKLNTIKPSGTKFVDVRILKDFTSESEPELFIFEQTLKIKEISYKVYKSFGQLENDVNKIQSPMVVIDSIFQKEVVSLLNKKKTKIVCFSNLQEEEKFLPNISFVTNNFQEIANQISILKSFKMAPLSTTKIFLCATNKHFFRYKSTFEEFNLQVRLFNDVKEIFKITKFYFSLVIVCPEEEKNTIEKEVAAEGLAFRVQVLGLMEDTENSVKGLRKILRQVKRGYLVEKETCKMVDIIDKYHNSSKFQDIKKQLNKNDIAYRCFDDFPSFAKNEVYCAPIIICNYSQRQLLAHYLEQVQSKSKIIIYCNKNKIYSGLAEEKKWAYVSSHFGKIINFIKINKMLVPVILDHNQKRIQLKQEKIKNKQHRISALKWSDTNLNSPAPKKGPQGTIGKTVSIKQPEVSFIVPKLNINPLQVKEISHDASALLKLSYQPTKKFQQFKKDLIVSLLFLKQKYKLNFSQSVFEELLGSIPSKNLQQLALRTRQFLGQQKQMGIKINQSLRRLQSLEEKELKHLREVIYLMNLNFITYYEMPAIKSVRLVHWTKETLLEQCLTEGVIIFKNFLVMHEEGTTDPIPGCIKIEVEIEYNSLTDSNLPICSYFQFQDRYVFAPYTQFKVKSYSGENQAVASLQLIKRPDFLGYYFQQNISSDLSSCFNDNISNSGPLVDSESKEKVISNIQRCSILKMSRTGLYDKAAASQQALLKKAEQVQNIDNKYINQLLFELAYYQFKNESIDQLLKTVEQVTNNQPIPFIKRQCSILLSKITKQISKDLLIKNPLQVKQTNQRTQKCIELKENIQKQEEHSQEGEHRSIQSGEGDRNIFELQKCLEIQDNYGQFEYFE